MASAVVNEICVPGSVVDACVEDGARWGGELVGVRRWELELFLEEEEVEFGLAGETGGDEAGEEERCSGCFVFHLPIK